MKLIKNIICIFLLAVFVGCEKKPQMRVYEESHLTPSLASPQSVMQLPDGHPSVTPGMNMSDPSMQSMVQSSAASVPLTWQAPKGWKEEKGSGMRLATFTSGDAHPITCTIVSLSGMAGGVESNIIRWMKQINLSDNLLAGEKMQEFLKKQEVIKSKNNLSVQIVDLTPLTGKNESTQTILGGIVEMQDTTIFIKMTGDLKGITSNREAFRSLCQSLTLNE